MEKSHLPAIRVPLISADAGLLIVLTAMGSLACTLVLLTPALPLEQYYQGIFSHLLFRYDAPATLVGLFLLLVSVAVAPFCRALGGLIADWGSHPWRLALPAGIGLAFCARYVYHAHPLSMDEYAVWFQSQLFAAGRLAAQFPPEWLDRLVPVPFQNHFLTVSHATGQVTSAYWPGFALVMAPFSLIGAEWLCNPVLTMFSLLAIARTCHLIFPEEKNIAGWAMSFSLASPAFVAMGISYYAMTALLLFNLIFVWGFLSPSPKRLFLTGLAGSVALTLHNPFPHLLFAAPWLLHFLLHRPPWRQLLALLAGYAPLSLLLGLGWVLFKAGLPHEARPAQDLAALFSSAFSLPDDAILYRRLAGTIKLWLWAVPGLLVFACLGYRRWRENNAVRLLCASALLTFIGYFFVPFDQGHGWGYRYFHPAWSVLPILAAAAVAGGSNKGGYWTLENQAGALVLCSLLCLVPLQLRNIDNFIGQHLAQLPAVPEDKRSVVFLYPGQGLYLMDLVQNDPLLRNHSLRLVGNGPGEDGEFLHHAKLPAASLPASAFGQAWLLP